MGRYNRLVRWVRKKKLFTLAEYLAYCLTEGINTAIAMNYLSTMVARGLVRQANHNVYVVAG